jgi:DNA primase
MMPERPLAADRSIEALKQVNLVEFLSRHYGLQFRRRGAAFACISPFGEESIPSFFVRQIDGRWLFKDFSSGTGGTIFDFVRMKEKLGSFTEALIFIKRMMPSSSFGYERGSPSRSGSVATRRYNVNALYERFRQEDPGVCRQYLLRRAIHPALVEELVRDGTVVHNRYGGRSYCCFAVRDAAGALRCLDNHAVEGRRKFVLGSKSPFSREWKEVKRAQIVFLAEGVIDYLSVKTLECTPPPGLALLGNQLSFERSLLERVEVLVSAFDGDRGGNSALAALTQRYPGTKIQIYDLKGYKDPNELLLSLQSGKK